MDTTRRCPTARLPQDGSPAPPFTACRSLATLTYTVELARTTKTFPSRRTPHRAVAPLSCRCGRASHQRAQHAQRRCRVRRTMAPLNDLALRVDDAALRRQDGNARAGHRTRECRLAERHHRRRRPGEHRGRAQPPAAPDARSQAAADALCQRCEPRAAHAHRGDSGLREHARPLGQRRSGRAGGIHRVPQGRKRAHARARGAAAVFGARRCRPHRTEAWTPTWPHWSARCARNRR